MLGVIHGRLTRDVELKSYKTKSGEDGSIANFTVASANRFGAKTESSFYPCVIFGKRATVIANHFSKGSEIVLTGNLEQEEWEDKEGNKKRSWKMTVSDFDFVGSNKQNQTGSNQTDSTPNGFESVDEDIPF